MDIDLSKKMYEGEPETRKNKNFEINQINEDEHEDEYEYEEDEDAFVIDKSLNSDGSGQPPVVAIKKENARSRIALLYVSSFLAIIIIVFAYSLFSALKINDIKDLLVTISGIMSGPLGFIIGYYFKSEDDNNR